MIAACIVAAARHGRVVCAGLACLVLANCSGANPDFADTKAAPALWQVENPSGEIEGWLFGTIHALPDNVRWQTPAIQSAIDRSAALVLEISPEDQTQLSRIFGELANTSNMPDLMTRVDRAKRPALAALLRKAGYKSSDFAATETWAAALTLARANSAGEFSNGVDVALSGQFEDFLVLEGARAQLSIFDSLPEAEQVDLLEAVADEGASSSNQDQARLAKTWLSGDMDALAGETTQGILADPELRSALLVNRNLDWVRKIDDWFAVKEPFLVAVGAAHMAGEDGLPSLLRARGFTVRRIQ